MSDDEQAIRNAMDTWMAASAAGDVTTILSLMADDVMFLVSGQKFGKADFAARTRDLRDVRIEGRSDIREIEIAGSWAWCRADLSVAMTSPDGKTVQRAGPSLTIWRKRSDGRWVLLRDANLLAHQSE
jgi:uncharacterized protein (TIGR02246 family)